MADTLDPVLLTTFPCPWCDRLLAGYQLPDRLRMTQFSAAHWLEHAEGGDAG